MWKVSAADDATLQGDVMEEIPDANKAILGMAQLQDGGVDRVHIGMAWRRGTWRSTARGWLYAKYQLRTRQNSAAGRSIVAYPPRTEQYLAEHHHTGFRQIEVPPAHNAILGIAGHIMRVPSWRRFAVYIGNDVTQNIRFAYKAILGMAPL